MKLKALLIGVFVASLCSSAVLTHEVSALDTTVVPTIPEPIAVHTTPLDEYLAQSMRYRAWNSLCFDYARMTDRSCLGVPTPKVKRATMEDRLRGYYDGGDTVYINRKLTGRQARATLIHEMSHYLDTMLGLNPKMPVKVSNKPAVFKLCMSEKRAWDLTDQHWRDTGFGSKAVDGDWVKWYAHCREFAHELYPEKYDGPLPNRAIPWFDIRGRA